MALFQRTAVDVLQSSANQRTGFSGILPHPMNYLDIVLIIPLLWGLYKGFTKGLIIEVASLIALGLGIWGSIHFSDLTAAWLTKQFAWETEYLPVVAFAITFVGIVMGVYACAKLLERVVNLVALKFVNKLGGAVFGALKLGLIASVLLLIVDGLDQRIDFIPDGDKSGSILYEPVMSIAGVVIPGVQESGVMDYVEAQQQQLAEGVEETVREQVMEQVRDSIETMMSDSTGVND